MTTLNISNSQFGFKSEIVDQTTGKSLAFMGMDWKGKIERFLLNILELKYKDFKPIKVIFKATPENQLPEKCYATKAAIKNFITEELKIFCTHRGVDLPKKNLTEKLNEAFAAKNGIDLIAILEEFKAQAVEDSFQVMEEKHYNYCKDTDAPFDQQFFEKVIAAWAENPSESAEAVSNVLATQAMILSVDTLTTILDKFRLNITKKLEMPTDVSIYPKDRRLKFESQEDWYNFGLEFDNTSQQIILTNKSDAPEETYRSLRLFIRLLNGYLSQGISPWGAIQPFENALKKIKSTLPKIN